MSLEEVIAILYYKGSFLRTKTTGYGSTYHCSECEYYISGCSGDPKEHESNCRLGQALKIGKEIYGKTRH